MAYSLPNKRAANEASKGLWPSPSKKKKAPCKGKKKCVAKKKK